MAAAGPSLMNSKAQNVAAIVLAAGLASRYRAAGGAETSKLLAHYHGEPLARLAVKAALAAGCETTVVTGHARDQVEAALKDLRVAFVHNPAYATGLASSLKTGVAALPPSAEGAFVLLADMPGVSADLITRLAAAFAKKPDALAVIPVHKGKRGNPVLLARALFGEIANLSGDEGARRLLQRADAACVVELDLADDAVALDIDTPDDLTRSALLLFTEEGGQKPDKGKP